MLRSFLSALGVDFDQWVALTKASIRMDLRESTMAPSLRYGRSGAHAFLYLIFFYLFSGLIFAILIFSNTAVVFTLTLLITYAMFMISGLILVEYHTVVVSPDDYDILSYRPVSSTTYFWAKFTNILFYTVMFTLAMALPGAIAFTFVSGFNPGLGLVAFLSVLWANVTAVLTMVVLYSLILNKVSLHRLRSVLAYLQVFLSVFIYGGYFFLPKIIEGTAFHTLQTSDARWLTFFPPAWFSSFLKFYLGEAEPSLWFEIALVLGFTILLIYYAQSRISIAYSERLSELAGAPVTKRKSKSRLRLPRFLPFRGFEERVVSKLIWSQFRNDNKFKMAVLGILPLTLFYLAMGLEEGPLIDPFISAQFNIGRTGFLYFVVLLFPLMLRTLVSQSDAYRASWIFYTSPADVRLLILTVKRVLMFFFVQPFLLVMGLIFYYFFQNILHVFLHLVVLGLFAQLMLQLGFLYSPELPFSRPNVKGSRSRNLTLILVVIPIFVFGIFPFVFKYVYPSAGWLAVFFGVGLLLTLSLEKLIRLRIATKVGKLEFVG